MGRRKLGGFFRGDFLQTAMIILFNKMILISFII